ncbi:MAG TPA: hybrid sensor histidine kinase/response regulator [Burkholderiales bacterium]|nr:hybrid sensor histidine kinase/response regulator [Burkholderiales bacterium]
MSRQSADRATRRQLELFMRQSKRALGSAVFGGCLIIWLAVGEAGWRVALGWAALMVCAFGLRSLLLAPYAPRLSEQECDQATVLRAERILVLSTSLIGAVVASAAWWFFPFVSEQTKLLLTVILCGWPAIGVAVQGPHPKSFRSYLLVYCATLAGAWVYYLPQHPAIAFGIMVYPFVLGLASRDIGAMVVTVSNLESEQIRLNQEKDVLLERRNTLIEELEAAKTAAENATLAKSRFLAAASHDLRQPVQALSLLAGVLKATVADPRQREISLQIARASESLEHLFSAILDLSKLEAGTISPEARTLNVGDLMSRLASEYGSKSAAKGLQMICEPRGLWINTDPVLFERVIRNLLENAVRYTERGQVGLALDQTDKGFVLQVSDTGAGIPESEQARIFEEFYQLDTTDASSRNIGLGLGLAIVKRLAALLRLEISLQSTEGRGSTFSVHIPASAVTIGNKPEPFNMITSPGHPALSGCPVLVIDDDQLVREALALALKAWGAQPYTYAALPAALAGLKRDHASPRIAILDYRLAEGPVGLDVAEEVRLSFPDIKRIMMTGELNQPELAEAGMPVLKKPVAHDELRRIISDMLTTVH